MTTSSEFTGNRLVAYNLRHIRESRALTQQQAAAILEPYVGSLWSKAVYSAAERSADTDRVRQFTADDLLALSLAFDVPIAYWFLPPRPQDRRRRPLEVGPRRVKWRDEVGACVLGSDWRRDVVTRLRGDAELVADEGALADTITRRVRLTVEQMHGRLQERAGQLRDAADALDELHEAAASAPLEQALTDATAAVAESEGQR